METTILRKCPNCDSRNLNLLSSGGRRPSNTTYFCLECSVEITDRPKSDKLVVAMLNASGDIAKCFTVDRVSKYYETA